MTANDIKTGQEMLKEEFIQSNPEWAKVSVYINAILRL